MFPQFQQLEGQGVAATIGRTFVESLSRPAQATLLKNIIVANHKGSTANLHQLGPQRKPAQSTLLPSQERCPQQLPQIKALGHTPRSNTSLHHQPS